MNNTQIINLKTPLSSQNAQALQRANALRTRVEDVKQSLESAPSDSIVLDQSASNPRLGAFSYTGQIGTDQFSKAHVSMRNGKLDAFAAHDPKATPGETIKFHTVTSEATGLRAGIAGAFGAIGGGLGNVAAWFFVQANSADNSDLTRNVCAISMTPFTFGHDLMHFVEQKVSDPGTRDQVYAKASPNGDYEQHIFTANGQLETLVRSSDS